MIKEITSTQNPFIKNIVLLAAKSRERKQQGLFVAEGWREVGLALKNGYEAEALLYDSSQTREEPIQALARQATLPVNEVIAVNAPVFEKIAYRSGVPNVVAVLKEKIHAPKSIIFQKTPLLLVLESIEKPGNLGAILRTADAAAVDAVVVCDPLADPYNPNAIRASLGAVFTVPVLVLPPEEAVSWLQEKNIRLLSTWLEAATPLYQCDLCQPTAFVLGAEANGISRFWVEQANERIIIPMAGQVDSLNVAASAAVVLFEAVRQRSLKP
ncbi:MAG: TrmH family RNA methyltransferase [Saprospiraceae bacterium]